MVINTGRLDFMQPINLIFHKDITIEQIKKEMSKEQCDLYKNALLKYCELDTYAMVRVLDKLRELASTGIKTKIADKISSKP
jgi:hypothetical protein